MPPYRDGTSQLSDRTPPQDMEAEQCVLGAMLMSKDAIADVVETIRGSDFYRPAHEQIYNAITDLYGRGEPADAVTVADELGKRGELLRLGGAPYLHTLLASVPIAANAGWYAEIVREKAVLRRLVDASVRIGQMSFAGEGDVDDIVDRAQAEVYAVTDRRAAEDYKPLSELMQPTLDEMEAIESRGAGLSGVPTGFADLDDLTNGLHPGQLVIVAARPGIGKALALDTPLPTPTGWTTMGEVQVGDQLLGSDGRPTQVVAATDVMIDRPCYEVTFSDGTSVIADADHQWRVVPSARRPASPSMWPTPQRRSVMLRARTTRKQVKPTAYLNPRAGNPWAFSMPGDGGHQHGRFGRVDQAKSCTLVLDRRSCGRVENGFGEVVTTEGMARLVARSGGQPNWAVAVARPLDLAPADLPIPPYALGASLGATAHQRIPAVYLRASTTQRQELLAGLMAAQGAGRSTGTVDVAVSDPHLAADVLELTLSLGYRATSAAGSAGERSVAYTVTFDAAAHRSITSIRSVPSVAVRCVQVDNADHTYLCTRSMIPTHNSTLALDLARAASIKNGLSSVIFSLEMSQLEITMRLLSAEAGVPLSHIRGGRMNDQDWNRVSAKMGQVSEAPMFIDDSPNLTMMEIRAKARRLKQRHDLRLIVIDYIQLMTSGKKVESRQVEVSEFSRQLKLLAKELDVPVIALSQLNRGPEQRNDKRPMLSDLRESGSLEQDADLVILLNRPDLYDKDSERAGEADFDVAKHRNGPTKVITVAFQGHYSRFADMQL
ncbi:MAG TPA: replicative DNA helicase [Propionibacteriaceae bacterium]|nr:replicative DNA helicase [Propionibacteriaceae bacterium]